jgi:hypothetical protein
MRLCGNLEQEFHDCHTVHTELHNHVMNNQAPSFLADQAWLFPLFILAWLAVWTVATCSISRLSGWSFLAHKFKATTQIDGDEYRFVSGSIGRRVLPVNYGHCLFVTVGKTGLHLSMFLPFRLGSPPLFIPWSEIEEVKAKRFLYLFPSVTLRMNESWPLISLRGRIHNAILDGFSKHSRGVKDHRTSWRDK